MAFRDTQYELVSYRDNQYYVGYIEDTETLFVIDESDRGKIENNCSYYNYVKIGHNYLHRHLIGEPFTGKNYVDHINRITRDNRRKNIRITTQTTQNHNQYKKDRKVELPLECNISPNDLPTHIWLAKGDGEHGDRFVIEIKGLSDKFEKGEYVWKSSSSSVYSLRVKLLMTILKLIEVREQYPEIKSITRINKGDELERKNSVDDFNNIIGLSNYPRGTIETNLVTFKTDIVDILFTPEEKLEALKALNIQSSGKKKESKLPPNCGVEFEDIPQYCYYCPKKYKKDNCNNPTNIIERSDKFVIDRHPALVKSGVRQWSTDGSKKKTTLEKYKELLDKLKDISS